jgi:chaperonin GroEL
MDNLYIGEEGRIRLMKGISRASQAVASTMGAAGSNALLEKFEAPFHGTSNDGISILDAIHFEDPLEEMGRRVLFEAVSRANRSSGDGSSTTTVLTAAILEEGAKHKDISPIELKESLEACIPLIEKSLKAQTRQVVKNGKIDIKLLEQVATVSAESEDIGKRIAEIYSKIGSDGIVQWEASNTTEDYYEIGKGITVHGATYGHKFMCDADPKTGQLTNSIKLKNPLILISKQKITSLNNIVNLVRQLMEQGSKELVIFCEEVDPQAMGEAFTMRAQPRDVNGNPADPFRMIFVKMPVLWKDWWYEDLAEATGATVMGDTLKLKEARLSHLGSVENLTVTKEDVILEGIKDLSTYILQLKGDGTDNEALLRASRLNTMSARYFVGGFSEQDVFYRRFKIEDAINTASEALRGGVVAGGGVALLNTSSDWLGKGKENVGETILGISLCEPTRIIIKNANGMDAIFDVGGEFGFNAKTKKVVNMFDAGIVDSTDVILSAVKSAIGVAATILTTNTIVLLNKEPKK